MCGVQFCRTNGAMVVLERTNNLTPKQRLVSMSAGLLGIHWHPEENVSLCGSELRSLLSTLHVALYLDYDPQSVRSRDTTSSNFPADLAKRLDG